MNRRGFRGLSLVFVLLREQVLTYFFGAGNFADTFNVALQLPQLSGNLLGRMRARKLAWGAGIAVVGILLSPLMIGVLARGYKPIPVKLELTVQLSQMLFLLVPIFAEGALDSLVFCATSAIAALMAMLGLLPSLLGVEVKPIFGIALGWIVGGVAFSIWRPLTLKRVPAKESSAPTAKGWMLPTLLALCVVLGASSGPGVASWLAYGSRFAQLALAALLISGLGLPWILIVGFLSFPLTRLFLQYGRFYAEDSIQVATMMSIFLLTALLCLGCERLVVEAMDPGQRRRSAIVNWALLGCFVVTELVQAGRWSWSVQAGLTVAVAGIQLSSTIWILGFERIRSRIAPLAREIALGVGVGASALLVHVILDHWIAEAFRPSILVPFLRLAKLAGVGYGGWILLKFLQNSLTRRQALS